MNIFTFLSNGGVSKFLWIVTVFLLTIGCMFVAGWELLHNQPVNVLVENVLAGIFGHVMTLGGAVNVTSQHKQGTSP